MAGIWDTIERFERTLRHTSRSTGRWNRSRSRSGSTDEASFSLRPNAPRMITVLLSVALAVAGLVVTGTLEIGFVSDLLAKTGYAFTREHGYWMLLGSPALLIVGSLLPGV
ncbi:MAG: hypothetical protein LC722_04525 [Actinobacteria bacterium]|nr:hypothetical protein [Actinomycetota bacterium]